MGAPRFAPAEIPFVGGSAAPTQALEVAGAPVTHHRAVDGQSACGAGGRRRRRGAGDQPGPAASSAIRAFPRRVNAGYMQVVDRANIRLRVWERGAGETLACGTGACAAVVAGIRRGLLDSPVRVATRGGELAIRWGGRGRAGA